MPLCLLLAHAAVVWALLLSASTTMHNVQALVNDPAANDPPDVDQTRYHTEASAAFSNIVPGVCYSPMHNPEYPLGGRAGNVNMLGDAMYRDFSIMKNYFRVVRTYYSSFYGVPVTPAAAANGVKLYLGVYMTNEAWYANQVNDAIAAVKAYPDTILAILVGNENIQPMGPYTPQEVSNRITNLRARVRAETGRNIPVGTVQRATEWLETGDRNAIAALAANCDLIGVNIYPFFDANYNPSWPLAILDGVWDKMVAKYPAAKLRLTEVGFPTDGAPLSYAPKNVPSIANSKAFYTAFRSWSPSAGGGEAFWFMFFDRAPDDDSMGIELETHFGFYTCTKASKASSYPVLISAQTVAPPPSTAVVTTTTVPAPAPTPAPTTQAPPTPAPTTKPPVTAAPVTPPPTTRAPTPSSIVIPTLPSTVCRVKKLYIPN